MSEEKKFRYVWVAVAIALVIGIGAAARENYFPSIRADRIVSTKDVTTTDNVTTANITQANIVTDNVTTLHAGSMTVADMIATRQSLLKNACVVSTNTSITSHSDATQTGSLAWCVTQLGSTGTIFLPEKAAVYTINSNYSVPEGITIIASAGAIIAPENSITLSVYGTYSATPRKSFAGLGTIAFPIGSRTPEVWSDWWVDGGNGTETNPWTSTLDTAAGVNKALLSGARVVRTGPGYYAGSSTVRIYDFQEWKGAGRERTIFTSTSTSGQTVLIGDTTKTVATEYAALRGFTLKTAQDSTVGVQLTVGRRHTLDDLHIFMTGDNDTGIWLDSGRRATHDGAIGNFFHRITGVRMYLGYNAESHGLGSLGLNIDGYTDAYAQDFIETDNGSMYCGNCGKSNDNDFYSIHIQGGTYCTRFGPSRSNSIIGLLCEFTGNDNRTDAYIIKFDNWAQSNIVKRVYAETSSYLGKGVLADTKITTFTDPDANAISRPLNNRVEDFYIGAGLGVADHSIPYTNVVTNGVNIYGSAPDEDDTDNASATQISVLNGRIPGEATRVRLRTDGLRFDTGEDASHAAGADTYVVFTGGPTNKANSFATSENPDLNYGLNLFIQDFDDNDTNITSFENAKGAPYVLMHPYPQANNLKITFTDSATDTFRLYNDSNYLDDNITISGAGTGTTVVRFKKANHRYMLHFGCYESSTTMRQWLLLNNVRGADATQVSPITAGANKTIPFSTGSAFSSDDNLTFDSATDILETNNLKADKLQAGSNATNGLRLMKSAGTTTMMNFDTVNNRIGLWTETPTYDFSFDGDQDNTIGVERRTTSTYEGNNLTLRAGSATSGSTDKNGGPLNLRGGVSTGTGYSSINLSTAFSGAAGVTDNVNTNTMFQIQGNKLGFFGVTTVVKQTELTDELTTVSVTDPAASDYAMDNGTFGFSTLNEFRSAVKVIANLQARVNELETKLTAYGLLTDAD